MPVVDDLTRPKADEVAAEYVVLASSLHAGFPLASVFHTLFAWPEPEAT